MTSPDFPKDQPIPYAVAGMQPPCEFTAGPSGFGPMWSDFRLANILQAWTTTATLTETVTVHEPCTHEDCNAVLCMCLTRRPCPGTADVGCPHYSYACDEHRAEVCDDCAIDAWDR